MTSSAALVLAPEQEFPTPEYFACITDPRFRYNVYEPEADTFLFLSALTKERDQLRRLRPRRCVEVGCGSGTVITYIHTLLCMRREGEAEESCCCPHTAFYAVDVNPMALEATGLTWSTTGEKQFHTSFSVNYGDTSLAPAVATLAGAAEQQDHSPLHLVEGDLLTYFDEQEGTEMLDVVLFNPPYVPTSMDELQDAVEKKDVITAAWCGGTKGRVVLDRFLRMLPSRLAVPGVCYVVLIKENDPPDVEQCVRAIFREAGHAEDTIHFSCIEQRYTGEHLGVYRIARGLSLRDG